MSECNIRGILVTYRLNTFIISFYFMFLFILRMKLGKSFSNYFKAFGKIL